jgi:uncharacterized membrane protein YfcA
MDSGHLIILCLAIAGVAILYSCVGQAGTTGYIAILTLFGFSATYIRPTALMLGILVASIGTIQFWRTGHLPWRLFWPFALPSVPAAYIGGSLQVPYLVLNLLLGAVLLLSAIRLFLRQAEPAKIRRPGVSIVLTVGVVIGFLAGLTGTGGGYILAPLVLFCGWARTREAAGITPAFILVNSVAGTIGYINSGQPVPSVATVLAFAAVAGGMIGSHLGSRNLPVRFVQLVLAVVLVLAGVKLIFTR